MTRVVAIANPATRGKVDRTIAILRAAAPPGVDLDVRVTEYAGHAAVLARSMGEDVAMVVAIGGDGTVAEVAGALRGGTVPLGIVPGGSTNIIARELGIPVNTRQASRLLFKQHRLVAIDVGTCGERVFLHMAGAGFDSEFFEMTNPVYKRRVGWLAYMPAAVRALRRPPVRYIVRTPDTVVDTISPLVLIANGASIINPRLRLDRRIAKDDGLLDVLIITATTPLQLARVLARVMAMRLERSRYVIHLTATEIELESEPSISVELDGDVVTATPVRFGIDPGAIRIIAPA